MRRHAFRVLAVVSTVVVAALGMQTALASAGGNHVAGQESNNLTQQMSDRAAARTAPATSIDPGAYPAAVSFAAAAGNGTSSWTEVGPYNYFTDDPTYSDPNWSNSGSGDQYVSGRVTAVAATANGATVVAGGADGGLWRSTDAGAHWTPVGDGLETLSIGALAVDESAGCVFYAGTGEANTSSDSYAGVGLYRSTDCGVSWQKFGPTSLAGAIIWRIRVDFGRLFVASSHGLYRLDNAGNVTARYTPGGSDFVGNQFTDVAVRPGTGGQVVLAADGWRNGDVHNGLYLSTDSGTTFTRLANPQGYLPQSQQGRVSLAYAADGGTLYLVDEDPTQLVDSSKGVYSALGGVFVSRNGNPSGPYNQIATPSKLSNSGSAERVSQGMKGYQPGVQAWYNQFLAVDPANSGHLYLGLEEVYETLDGGSNWNTIAPYWNLTLPCFSYSPFEGTCDKNQAHSDQHAAYIANGTLWIGNDGGVWSRSLANHNQGQWTNLNRTLGTLQFYYGGAGQAKGGPLTFYGGLQDNGTAKFQPSTGLAVQPFGGDGGDVSVDPGNPDNVITEYVYLTMARSNDGGHSWTTIAPSDPNPRFIAPFESDRTSPSHLVAGGQYVWESNRGFATSASDWTASYDTGAGHSITALDTAGGTTYAGWCGPCNPNMHTGSGAPFNSGIATNYGGTWHQLTPPLANRYPSGAWVDPNDGSHAYVSYSGYSRRWIASPYDAGVGHVFETRDGGATWTNVSGDGTQAGDLLDAPTSDVLLVGKHLVVATDFGVWESSTPDGGTWTRVGVNFPNVVVDDLSLTPSGNAIIAATHGRGMWTFPTSSL